MAEESERWQRTQGKSNIREPFHAKASPVALHTDPARHRNLDKEEAARDRLIFRWVLLLVAACGLIGLMIFIVNRLGNG